MEAQDVQTVVRTSVPSPLRPFGRVRKLRQFERVETNRPNQGQDDRQCAVGRGRKRQPVGGISRRQEPVGGLAGTSRRVRDVGSGTPLDRRSHTGDGQPGIPPSPDRREAPIHVPGMWPQYGKAERRSIRGYAPVDGSVGERCGRRYKREYPDGRHRPVARLEREHPVRRRSKGTLEQRIMELVTEELASL